MPAELDCTLCGACCLSPLPGDAYIRLEPDEAERLSALELPVHADHSLDEPLLQLGTRLRRSGQRVCIAFEGRVGGRCACTIYEVRPALCRQFTAGTSECLQARRAAGL